MTQTIKETLRVSLTWRIRSKYIILIALIIHLITEMNGEMDTEKSVKRISRSSYLPETSSYKYTSDAEANIKYRELQKQRYSRVPVNSSIYRMIQKQKNTSAENMVTSTPISDDNNDFTVPFSFLLNASTSPLIGRRIFDEIYDKQGNNDSTRHERFQQIGSWLTDQDPIVGDASTKFEVKADPLESRMSHERPETSKSHFAEHTMATDESRSDEEYSNDYDDENGDGPSGTTKTPPCAEHGRYYCSFNEDYPTKVVTEVARYYKWPLEKLFRDLRQQVMPKLANDNYGGLVCDSVTRVVRPGWAKNTNNRWLVVINTDHYQQFVSEVICRHGSGSYCNFIPPCYQATCRQRYNTQKLLVIDPWNPYKGPFLSEFLFPSCCICFVPDSNDSHYGASSNEALKKRTDVEKSEL